MPFHLPPAVFHPSCNTTHTHTCRTPCIPPFARRIILQRRRPLYILTLPYHPPSAVSRRIPPIARGRPRLGSGEGPVGMLEVAGRHTGEGPVGMLGGGGPAETPGSEFRV
jgi:hypothetical protein